MQHDYCKRMNNVLIRPLTKNDIDLLRDWRNNKYNSVHLSKISYINEEAQLKWYNSYLQRNNEIFFVIEETEKFHQVVGTISLYDIQNQYCVLGKILIGEQRFRGCGIGTNAIKAALSVAFETLALSVVRLYVYKENETAINIYKHVGFYIVDEHCDSDGKSEYTMELKGLI